MPSRLSRLLLATGAALTLATPAFAQDARLPMPMPAPQAMPMPAAPAMATPHAAPGYDTAAYERARADWLDECRRTYGSGRAVGGGLAGGLIGGLLGNRIGGRKGRTEGTIVGAVAGAAAGAAIGNAADRREARERRDYCEAYLDRYAAYNPGGTGYPAHGYGYAMQPMMVMVPVAMTQPVATQAAKPQECVEETVTEEYDAPPPARRIIPPRPPKRQKIAPTKRVRVY